MTECIECQEELRNQEQICFMCGTEQFSKYSKEWYIRRERKFISHAIEHDKMEYHGLCDICEGNSDYLWKVANLHKDWLNRNHPEHYRRLNPTPITC